MEFTTDTYPGKVFQGKISFIDPFLNEKSRTAMVRVNVPNAEGTLKPGMYVRAIVRPILAADGSVRAPDLAGKWLSPMHPHIVHDEPGVCPICGMELVSAESLGYVSEEDGESEPPLVIPHTAPLLTGKRAIVYVQLPDKSGIFEAREVVLGPRTKNSYIVQEGLEEGELVVSNGNFKIDSAAQILAKPSMMAPKGGEKPVKGHQHGQ
jgi:Cu(I)/Ag(I) efflux system membrane fusion protein